MCHHTFDNKFPCKNYHKHQYNCHYNSPYHMILYNYLCNHHHICQNTLSYNHLYMMTNNHQNSCLYIRLYML